jgi:hypothetical protein
MLHIDSIHEFPTLCDSSIGVQDIVSHHRSVNSHAVAIDNRQSNSNSNSKSKSTCMLGGDSKSKIMFGGDSKSKIKNTCIDENGINGSQISSCVASVGKSKSVVESCVASFGKSKAVGGKSKAVGDNDSNDNNDDDNDDDVCTVWRSCVADNPPSLGKAGGQVLGSQPYEGVL